VLSKEEEQRLLQRAEHARHWLDNYAPSQVKFKVQAKLPSLSLKEEQLRFLRSIGEKLSDLSWTPDDIHNAIYQTATQENIAVKTAFTTLYQIILGQMHGPRAGFFLSNLDKQFVQQRIAEAIK